ncbi:leukocyte surface antigen CD47-like isoform X2 [Mastomys coucha]|uniref:leukocyte surface antigen CD47-like isoform X2 n=1 Tax=Mastomys coucha TaxID=35658 RepID=UPI00126150F3|nr:leukocyte surface antigen CD47-like isoform X2 [Mastomys coucha]
MWPLVAALLLGSFHCDLAQLNFKNINSVKVSRCNRVVLIPCYVSNIEAENINELFLKWKFGQDVILIFDGHANKSTIYTFPSAQISPSEFLKGNASLKLAKNEAKEGNYTCEVTELSRKGKHTVELKYSDGSWFTLSENIPIIILPFLTILLFWAQFGILIQKYKSNPMNRKILILSTSGLLITIVVIVGAVLFIPGNYSKRKGYGLILLTSPSVIPVFLQYHKFKPAIGRTLQAMIISTIVQALGVVLTLVGLYLIASGLVIVTLVELFGLIYMKWLDPLVVFQ